MRLAIVHDWLNQIGGAEDVLDVLTGMYPAAPIYTSIYDRHAMPDRYQQWDIRTLWLDKLPLIHRYHQPYLPLYPLAWGGLHLRDVDVVLSNKSGFCHGLRTDVRHICYCLAPTRYVWQLDAYIARENLSAPLAAALRPLVAALKRWDYAAAQRVDQFIAISTDIQQRIKTYYDRESQIIFPPVDTARFTPIAPSDVGEYFLIVSRLIPYKRIDLAVQAATRLGLPLKIGGRGRDMERLRAMAGPTVEFLGYVDDAALPSLMAHCKAFLFPGLEDFGITPVQAQAAGRPVIAFAGGGALDTVIPDVTGALFAAQTVDSLSEAMASFDTTRYDAAVLRQHALRFDTAAFVAQLRAVVDGVYPQTA
jgi:glycosyltransferase involved in cell wall biosynthesis